MGGDSKRFSETWYWQTGIRTIYIFFRLISSPPSLSLL
jgi:hypothetical protein